MSKPESTGALLRPRICVGGSKLFAIQIAPCPKCKEKIRLMWPVGMIEIPSHRVIHLDCPLCGKSFSLLAFDLVSICEGGEEYVVVEVQHMS